MATEHLTAIGKSFDLKNQKMTQKLGKVFGLCKRISFIVIILNREFNHACQEKHHSLVHKIYIIERNSSGKKYSIRGGIDKNPNEITSKSHMEELQPEETKNDEGINTSY